jgi:hypothetical protein
MHYQIQYFRKCGTDNTTDKQYFWDNFTKADLALKEFSFVMQKASKGTEHCSAIRLVRILDQEWEYPDEDNGYNSFSVIATWNREQRIT